MTDLVQLTYWDETTQTEKDCFPVVAEQATRNIGEIVASTIPLTDAGLHLLDGSLLAYGSYQAFIDYIADLYDSGDYTEIFETEVNWQTAVTTYGVCGKFVYDSVANTVRLPKITGFIEGASGITNLGDLTQAGLPNITQSNLDLFTSSINDGFIKNTTQRTFAVAGGGGYSGNGVTTFTVDASRSNSIYGNSNTVQPQSVKVLYYIVIATTTKTSIEVDIDEIATDLNGKADVDLSNVNNTGTSRVSGWSAPSSTYDDLTIGASGTTYTAPADGWFCAQGYDCSIMLVNASTPFISTSLLLNGFSAGNTYIPVKKGNTVVLYYNSTMNKFYFIYAEGSKWEA